MKKPKPLISVIVPVYNVENYIARCIDSILAQTYPDLEVLLVDDGSTDLSGALCDQFAQKDARVRVIHKENGGLSDARNTGMRQAAGKYFAFVDSDDYIAKDYIDYLYGMIEKYHAQIAVCGYQKVYSSDKNTKNIVCNLKKVCKKNTQNTTSQCQENQNSDIPINKNSSYRNKAGNHNSADSESVYNTEEGLRHLLYQRGMISSVWGRLFDASLFTSSIEIFFPIGKLHEDVAVMYKLFEAADVIVRGNEAKYYYFQRSDSIVNQQFDRRRMDYITFTRECIDFMEAHYPKLCRAAVSRHFSACFELLSCIDDNKRYEKEYRQLASEIKTYRCTVLRGFQCKIEEQAGGGWILCILSIGMEIEPHCFVNWSSSDR